MRGYLREGTREMNEPQDGWYDTGDIAQVDVDGFLFIRGRMKRFAKVSGEMVSLTAVEEAIAGAFPQYGLKIEVVVISKPDGEKGEKLVAVTNEPRLTLSDIRQVIREKEMPNFAAPREVLVVSSIPKLGTGKVNYRELEMAL
jgi:acyl-[acyl-carrier-protein]-phospholipid O-acyltransferase/long-chain-fatty-acid--[acyl-carrier-protein] ligase